MDCILHIGIGKAGSSTIQAVCQAYRDVLLERGVLYPEDLLPRKRRGGDNHKCLAVMAMRPGRTNIVLKQHSAENARARAGFNKSVLQLYKKQVKDSTADLCLLSAEHFWSALPSEEEIATVADNIEKVGLKVTKLLVYMRRQSDWFESIQYQRLREGHKDIKTDADSLLSQGTARHLDYAGVLDRWQMAFPEAEMIPRLFGKGLFEGGSLMDDFWAATGIEGHDLKVEKDKNVSAFSNAGLNALVEANRYLPAFLPNGKINPARQDIHHFIAGQMPGRIRVLPIPEMEKIDAHYAESNAEVCARWFKDRESLFPAPNWDPDVELYTPIDSPAFRSSVQRFAELWVDMRD